MKRKFYILAIALVIGLTGCTDFFGIKPLDKTSGDQLTETQGGLKALLANIYSRIPMECFAYRPNQGFWAHNYDGVNATTNIAMLCDEAVRADGTGIGEGMGYWPWQDLRQVNVFINDVAKAKAAGTVSETEAARYTSEAYFVRAYIYFGMAKRMGGVPIIDHAQDDEFVEGGADAVKIPRATEVDTWKFILADCDRAAANLPAVVSSDDGIYRASKWAALALKSRAALHAASVGKYWNEAPLAGPAVNDKLVGGFSASDVAFFYSECISASKEIINNSGKALYKPEPKDAAEAAENFNALFLDYSNEEVIFGRAYVNGTLYADQGHSYQQSYVLPQVNAGGALKHGRFNPTLNLVDVFEDYTDNGQGASAPIVTRTDGVEETVIDFQNGGLDINKPYKHYASLDAPFVNKDARLLASMIVPGSVYNGVNIVMQGGFIRPDGSVVVYANESAVGKDGKTYWSLGGASETEVSGFHYVGGGEGSNFSTTGFSVRKYMSGKNESGVENASTNPFIDMRLAEVYLNLAEAVVENNSTADFALAEKCLNDLRHRAAHKDNIPLTLNNVLKERQVELAFEGRRFWDLIRRREFHKVFNKTSRTALIPMLDLREDEPSYIFVRAYHFADENAGGRTFQNQSYYKSISNTSNNGLIQNPGY